MDIAKVKIGQALTSAASNHVVVVADDVYDEELEEYQSNLNAQFKDTLDSLDADAIAKVSQQIASLDTEALMGIAARVQTIAAEIASLDNSSLEGISQRLESVKTALDAAIAAETTARTTAITALESKVNGIKPSSESATDPYAKQSQITVLDSKINAINEKLSEAESSTSLDDIEALTTKIQDTDNRVNALLGEIMRFHAKTSFTVSPGVILVGRTTNINATATGTYGDDKAEAIVIRKKNAEGLYEDVKSGKNINSLTATETLSASATYKAIITMKEDIDFPIEKSVTAVHEVYYFFAPASLADSSNTFVNNGGLGYFTDDNMPKDKNGNVIAMSAVSGNFSCTNKEDGQKFFLCVPKDVREPSTFKMGGRDFVVNKLFIVTNKGVEYTIYASGSKFNHYERDGKTEVKADVSIS